MDPAAMEEKSKLVSSRIQKETAYKVVIKNYAYLVEHVDAIRIFPQLVASKLVEQDFRQRLERKETEKEKMMALLQALTRCTEETWFDSFTNALSKVPQYEKVTGTLLEDFKKTLEERMANPSEENASKDAPVLLHDDGAPVVKITVFGVDEVTKKAMENAQVAMKEARRDHSKALSALTKANDHVLEAEKGKVRAEAEKRDLEMTVHEVGRKLNESEAKLREADDKLRETGDKLREAEVHKQLLEVEFELKLKMKEDNATSAIQALEGELGEAERNKKKLDEVMRGLKEELKKNHTEHTKVQERQEEVVRKLKEELEKTHAEQAEAREKQDEVVRGLKADLERTMAEQADLQDRQEQKVSELMKKLEASNSDRDSLAKKYQDAEGDLETVKSELAQTQAELAELRQKCRDNLEQIFQTSPLLHGRSTMQSVKLPDLPIPTCDASAVMINDHIYVCGGLCGKGGVDLERQVQVYDVNHNVWSTLPHSPQYNSQGVAINSKLVLIGGREAVSEGVTNLVSTWTGQEWQQDLPPMPTKRFRPGVTTYHTFVVVAGGRDSQSLLSSIDILNTTTRQWWTPVNLQLPRPMFRMQCTISSAHLCVASAGISYDVATNTYTTDRDVWQLPVTGLEKVLFPGDDDTPHHWTKVAPTPYLDSVVLQDTAHIVAVGGYDNSSKPKSDIFVYNPDRDVWSKVCQLGVPHVRCAVVSLSKTSFIVCSGCTDTRRAHSTRLSSVEVVHV